MTEPGKADSFPKIIDSRLLNEQLKKLPESFLIFWDNIKRNLVRLPAFNRNDPEFWFEQIEGQFSRYGIIDDQDKFDEIKLQCTEDISEYVKSISGEDDCQVKETKYSRLKAKVIQDFTMSEEEKLKNLGHFRIDDEKPSDFLMRLRMQVGNSISECTLKQFFLEVMPENVRPILIVSEANLDNIAKQADLMIENAPQKVKKMQRDIAELKEQIRVVTEENKKLSVNNLQRNENENPTLCWKHKKYGKKAASCNGDPPCAWNSLQEAEKENAGKENKKHKLKKNGPGRPILLDKITGQDFLLSSGAQVSLYPRKLVQEAKLADLKLLDVTGNILDTYGIKEITLDLGLGSKIKWKFIITDVKRPVLGGDFCKKICMEVGPTGCIISKGSYKVQCIDDDVSKYDDESFIYTTKVKE